MADARYKHILLRNNSTTDRYVNPQGRGGQFKIMSGLDRNTHGRKLLSDLEKAQSDFINQIKQEDKESYDFQPGIKITFESWEGFELKFESLEDINTKIEILSIKEIGNKFYTTVRIPEGKLGVFFKKIQEYLDPKNDNESGKPSNADLISNIEKIKLAALENFWSDNESFPNNLDEKYFLEAWLWVGDSREEIINRFKKQALKSEIYVSEKYLEFPENTVFLIRASMNQLKQSELILDCISEIRISKDSPASFLEMKPLEEKEWVDDLKSRISWNENHKDIVVCILDTGVNYSHPLLTQSISEKDADSYNPYWGNTDHNNHGTEMAGLALFGDIFPLLTSSSPIVLNHSLESVKILPLNGSNIEELYGVITKGCVAMADLLGINKKRIFNMAVTSKITKIIEGEPTSWSTSIDQITFGNEESKEPKRLFFVSAGNVEYSEIKDYPDSNALNSVQNPAQAWNCITVGAFTEKIEIKKTKYPDLEIIAGKGELSPSSTTTLVWNESDWPIKPEIVMEGGNYAKDKNEFTTNLESLSLITTNRDFQSKLLTQCLDTSAATAQASRYAALIAVEYPNFWPETIRGIMVHSADYKRIKYEYAKIRKLIQVDKINILRKFGYGHPDLNIALNSGKNFCTMILQDEIQPFIKDGTVKTNEIKFYDLPWPVEALKQIPLEDVELKVTLSYFIEPNPKKINTRYQTTYSSCGLRFDSIGSTELPEIFMKRINANNREELPNQEHLERKRKKKEKGFKDPDREKWVFGSQLRSYGSIHSDVWIGSAADLAKKENICVYPVGGWWKTRKKLERFNNKIRYSLIITIKTKNNNVDIYNEIASKVGIPIKM